LPKGDEKLVVTSTNDPGTTLGSIQYGREVLGSMIIFSSTGSTSVLPTGGNPSGGGDLGTGVALQGCPSAGSTPGLSGVVVPGPAWTNTPTTSPAFTAGTATITVTNGIASLSFSGNQFTSSGANGSAQTSSNTCSSGLFIDSSGRPVAFSPDGIFVVSGSGGNPSVTDVSEGLFGIEQSGPPGSVPIATVASGTYDGFIGSLSNNGGSVGKVQAPYQLQPLTASMMQACPYSNFEAGTVNTATCAVITFTSQSGPEGVVLASVNVPGTGTVPGAFVIGQTSNGKYVIFGNVNGLLAEFLEH
jgi:hypothetical protein